MGAILKLLAAVGIAVGAQYLIQTRAADLDEARLTARVFLAVQLGRPLNSPELLDAAAACRRRNEARLGRTTVSASVFATDRYGGGTGDDIVEVDPEVCGPLCRDEAAAGAGDQ